MLWVATINGKLQPLDPAPDPERGNVIVVAAGAEVEGRGVLTRMGITITNLNDKAREAAEANGVKLFTPHHMTCPKNADRRFNRGG
jgi:hypothetical protein